MKKITEFQDPTQQDPSASEYTPLQQDTDTSMNDPLSPNQKQDSANIRLSQAQKFVLSKLMLPDQTPLIAYEQTSAGRNIVANRDTLVKLGMVEVGENSATITEKGQDALRDAGLLDDMGALTPLGEQYGFAEDLEAVGEIAAGQQNQLQGQGPDEPNANGPPIDTQMDDKSPTPDNTNPLESWSMISNMQTELSEKSFMLKHGKKL